MNSFSTTTSILLSKRTIVYHWNFLMTLIQTWEGLMCLVSHMARCTNVSTFAILPLHSEVVRGIVKACTNQRYRSNNHTMKKQANEVRNIILKIRLNDAEWKLVKKHQQKSTEQNLSSYVRTLALQRPVLINYRNQSADDFLKDMLLLKKELNGIGNNYNQAVHKLHMLEKIPEFRTWIANNENLHRLLISKVEEIKIRMNQLYDEWLQK